MAYLQVEEVKPVLAGLVDGVKPSSSVKLRCGFLDLNMWQYFERDDETHWALSYGSERYALGPRKPVS